MRWLGTRRPIDIARRLLERAVRGVGAAPAAVAALGNAGVVVRRVAGRGDLGIDGGGRGLGLSGAAHVE